MGSSKSLRLWTTRTSQCPTRDKPAGTPANLLTHQQASIRDTSKMTVCSASVLLASLSFFLSFFFNFLKASGDRSPLHAPRASPRLSSRNAQRSRLEIPDRRPFLWPKHLDRGPGVQEERGAAHRSPRWDSDTDRGGRGSTARGAPAPGRAGGPRQAEPRVPGPHHRLPQPSCGRCRAALPGARPLPGPLRVRPGSATGASTFRPSRGAPRPCAEEVGGSPRLPVAAPALAPLVRPRVAPAPPGEPPPTPLAPPRPASLLRAAPGGCGRRSRAKAELSYCS